MNRTLALLSFVLGGCTLFAIGAGVYVDREIREGIGVQDFHPPKRGGPARWIKTL